MYPILHIVQKNHTRKQLVNSTIEALYSTLSTKIKLPLNNDNSKKQKYIGKKISSKTLTT